MQDLSIGVLETRRDAKSRELAQIGPVLQGSVTTVRLTCGNSACKCARGEKHISHILTKKVNGKTKSVYVPVEMLEEAGKWTQNYRKMKKFMKEISDFNEKILKLHVKTRKAKKANLAAGKKKSRSAL